MPTPKTLPDRPSLESLRKQAKKLARHVASGDVAAIARVRAQLPNLAPPLSQRNAQWVLAREYGFAGWQELVGEVLQRSGDGLEWAAAQARRAIHAEDVEQLKQLLAKHPALLTWRDPVHREGLLMATTSYANDASLHEARYNRPACAELLLTAGAALEPMVLERIISTRSAGMLALLHGKGLLPDTLPVLAAVGAGPAVEACFEPSGVLVARTRPSGMDELGAVNAAFMNACRFGHEALGAWLLERCIALDADSRHGLAARIAGWGSRAAFVAYFCEHASQIERHALDVAPSTPWRTFVTHQLQQAMAAADIVTFRRWLDAEPWIMGEPFVGVQVQLIEIAAYGGHEACLDYWLACDLALLRLPKVPDSRAVVYALEYGNARLVPRLAPFWPLPDDLPHAAGTGDLERVRRWFGADGELQLGNPSAHYPASNPRARTDLLWGTLHTQQVLDVALAWAVVNHHFDVAEFLLEHGADIDTSWGTHEPASILHECALRADYAAAQFLIAHGIDLSIRDHRHAATAEGWARHAAGDEAMANFLAAAAERSASERVRD